MTRFTTIFRLGFLIAITSLSLVALSATSYARCISATSGTTVTIDIQACIDGRDLLIIEGGMLQWQHLDFQPVGLHPSCPKPFFDRAIVNTTFNGRRILKNRKWKIKWPNGTDSGAFSAVKAVCPSLPVDTPINVTLNPVQARGSISVDQNPSPSNNETTIVDFNDDDFGGPAIYEALLTFQVP